MTRALMRRIEDKNVKRRVRLDRGEEVAMGRRTYCNCLKSTEGAKDPQLDAADVLLRSGGEHVAQLRGPSPFFVTFRFGERREAGFGLRKLRLQQRRPPRRLWTPARLRNGFGSTPQGACR